MSKTDDYLERMMRAHSEAAARAREAFMTSLLTNRLDTHDGVTGIEQKEPPIS